MPDATGLKGLLMSGRSAGLMPRKKGTDTNLELEDNDPRKKKKKGFMDRFISKGSQADEMRKGAELLRDTVNKHRK